MHGLQGTLAERIFDMKTIAKFVAATASIALFCLAPVALAGKKVQAASDAGGYDVQYSKREIQPIAEGRIMQLSEAQGSNQGGGLEGFEVTDHISVDLENGN